MPKHKLSLLHYVNIVINKIRAFLRKIESEFTSKQLYIIFGVIASSCFPLS